MPHPLLSAAASAALLASLATAAGVPPAQGSAGQHGSARAAARATPTATASPMAATAPLTLINGDRVLVSSGPGGTRAAGVLRGAGGSPATSLMTLRLGTRVFLVPWAALPYFGRGLDPGLFELSALRHAERGGRLPVQISYRGHLPALPGITVTRSADGTAAGYLTAASATVFGAALARQMVADHSSGTYGTGGLFANGVSLRLPGAPPAPAQPAFPMHTLTVTGTTVAGRPDTGDMVLVGEVADANAPGTGWSFFYHGTAKLSVAAGTYWAVALFPQVSRGQLTALREDVLPQFAVARNTTVHTRALAASSKVTMTTPRPAIPQRTRLTLVRTAPHAPADGQSAKVSAVGWDTPGIPLWVSPVSRRPSYGTLRAFTSAQLTSPPGQKVPYGYTLDFAGPPGTIPSQDFVVHAADLATISERHVQDVRSAAGWDTVGGTPYEIRIGLSAARVLPVRLPARLVEYVSARPPMLWRTEYLEYRTVGDGQTPGGQTSTFRLLHAGQHLTEYWNAYPLHPGTNVSFPGTRATFVGYPVHPSAARAGNTLSLDLTPFSDNQPGHLGDGFDVPYPGKASQVSGRYTLYQNGTKIAAGNAATATGDVQVSATLSTRPSLVTFVLTASRASPQYQLSATSRDVWTWHSRPQPGATVPAPWACNFAGPPDRHCAVQPMITLNYTVAGLSLYGTTWPGHQAIAITAGHIQLAPQAAITRTRVLASFDGGRTWHPAKVMGSRGSYTAIFTAPAGANVSLRTSASDAAGSSITETIRDAYRTSS